MSKHSVNSVKLLTLLAWTIPSLAAAAYVSAEGVTTRSLSANNTGFHEDAARKGRDSLSRAVMHGNADKEPRDNTTDETLNVGENSPISAAQFPIAQYAGAVTMSGLQMLQNSGKEAIIDLMEGRVKVTEGQLQNRLDYDSYQNGKHTSAVSKFDDMLETPAKLSVVVYH